MTLMRRIQVLDDDNAWEICRQRAQNLGQRRQAARRGSHRNQVVPPVIGRYFQCNPTWLALCHIATSSLSGACVPPELYVGAAPDKNQAGFTLSDLAAIHGARIQKDFGGPNRGSFGHPGWRFLAHREHAVSGNTNYR